MKNESNRLFVEFSKLWAAALSLPDADDSFLEVAKKIGAAWQKLGLPETDDPIVDFSRLVILHPSASKENISANYTCARGDTFIDDLTRRAVGLAPGWSNNQWRAIILSCLGAKYEGSRIFVKKNPSFSKREAAKNMTPKQLMDRFKISRSYAYKLISKNTKRK